MKKMFSAFLRSARVGQCGRQNKVHLSDRTDDFDKCLADLVGNNSPKKDAGYYKDVDLTSLLSPRELRSAGIPPDEKFVWEALGVRFPLPENASECFKRGTSTSVVHKQHLGSSKYYKAPVVVNVKQKEDKNQNLEAELEKLIANESVFELEERDDMDLYRGESKKNIYAGFSISKSFTPVPDANLHCEQCFDQPGVYIQNQVHFDNFTFDHILKPPINSRTPPDQLDLSASKDLDVPVASFDPAPTATNAFNQQSKDTAGHFAVTKKYNVANLVDSYDPETADHRQ